MAAKQSPTSILVEAEVLKSEVEKVLEDEEELLHPHVEQDEGPVSPHGIHVQDHDAESQARRPKSALRALWKVPLITRRFLLQEPFVAPHAEVPRDKAALRALWRIPLILRQFMLRRPFREDAYDSAIEDDNDWCEHLMPHMRDRVTLRALWKMPLIIRRFILPKPVVLDEFTTPHRNKANLRVLWKIPLIIRRFVRAQKEHAAAGGDRTQKPLADGSFSAGSLRAFFPPVPPLDASIPNDPRVVVGRLPSNGLTYYVARNDRPAGQCFFRLVVKAGSLNEDDDQRGVAHLVEHVAFTETANFPEAAGGVARYLASVGLTAGADHNAFTFLGSTSYQLFGVPVGNDALIDAALLLLADIVGGRSLFRESTIDTERAVVLEELRLRTANYGKRLSDFKYGVQFPQSRHVLRDVGGDADVLRRVPHARVRNYYHSWYTPELAAVLVIGDIGVDDIIDKIRRTFGDIPKRAPLPREPRPPAPPAPAAVATTTQRFHFYYDDEALTPLFLVAGVEPKPPALVRRDTAAALREALLGRVIELAFNQRMLTISQSDHRQSTSAVFNCIANGVGLPPSVGGDFFETSYYVFPKMGGRGTRLRAFREFLVEHAKFYRYGLGRSELDKVKGIVAVGLHESSRKTELSGDMVDDCQSHFQHGDPFAEEKTLCEWSLALVANFTVQEVNDVIRTRRSLKDAIVIVSAPRSPAEAAADDDDEITEEQLVAVWNQVDSDTTIGSEWLDSDSGGNIRRPPSSSASGSVSAGDTTVPNSEVSPSPGAPGMLVDLSKLPPPGSVVAREQLTAPTLGQYQRLVLSNGAVVKVKYSNRKPGKVVINMVAKGGIGMLAVQQGLDAEEYERAVLSGRRADSIYNESGVGGVDLIDLMNVLHCTTVNFEANAAINHRYITAACSVGNGVSGSGSGAQSHFADFELLWQLVFLFFTYHELSPGAFERAQQHNLTSIHIGNKDPTSPFFDRLCELLYSDHVLFRRVRAAREERSRVSEAAAVAFWANCFSNVTEFDISIAGDIADQQQLEDILCRYLGVLPVPAGPVPTRQLFVNSMLPRRPPGTARDRVPCLLQLGAPAKTEIVFTVSDVAIGWVDFLTIDVLCLVVRDALEATLRTQLGATYAVTVGCHAPLYPSLSLLHVFIRFECTASQCDTAIDAALAELDRLRNSRISDEILQGLRESLRLRRERLLSEDDQHWRAVMVTCRDQDLLPEQVLQCEEQLLAISADDLTTLLQRCLAEEQSVVLTMLPHDE